MKAHRLVSHLFVTFSLLLITIAFTPLCLAQAKPATQSPAQRQLISITFLRIKPGMAPEWREFRKSETLPMLQKATVKQQTVWNTTIFGDGGFIIVTPIESLAQYDSPGPAARALGQEGAAAYAAKASRFTESARTIAIETRPELSLPPKPGEQYKLAVVTTVTIASGHDVDYENFVKTAVLPVIKKAAPKGYLVSQVVYGGSLNQYLSVVLVDSWADLQKYREAFAKEAAVAKLAARSTGIVTNRENAVYRFNPDLSVMPAPQKAENK